MEAKTESEKIIANNAVNNIDLSNEDQANSDDNEVIMDQRNGDNYSEIV